MEGMPINGQRWLIQVHPQKSDICTLYVIPNPFLATGNNKEKTNAVNAF